MVKNRLKSLLYLTILIISIQLVNADWQTFQSCALGDQEEGFFVWSQIVQRSNTGVIDYTSLPAPYTRLAVCAVHTYINTNPSSPPSTPAFPGYMPKFQTMA